MGTDLQRRLSTADEYHRMAEAGVLGPVDRVELVDGESVEMRPIGSPHAACVDRLARATVEAFTQPTPQGYRQSRRTGRGERLIPLAFPAATLLAGHVFGDPHV